MTGPATWTEARKDLAVKMWADGATSGEIADALGGVTRSAVCGIVQRAGMRRCADIADGMSDADLLTMLRLRDKGWSAYRIGQRLALSNNRAARVLARLDRDYRESEG